MKEFVFWQESLSIHQSALLRNLANINGIKVTLVVAKEIEAAREELGWPKPELGKTQIIVNPTVKAQSEILSGDLSNSVHIFPGSRRSKLMTWNAFRKSLSSNALIGIYSESFNRQGMKGLLRFLISKYDALKFRQRVNFILGVGSQGVNWFKRSGYFHNRIFRFAYFVEAPSIQNDHDPQDSLSTDTFDLTFVGQIIHRKGWNILLYALSELKSLDWLLHIVGDGIQKDKFFKLCERLEITRRIRFHGILPNSETIDFISKSDLLVLPSRWDGWGAVVNEALMLGVPVVCSDKCGAKDLLDDDERGEVFPSESILSLRSVLSGWITQGKKNATASEKIREWAKCINGKSGVEYFLQIINASITEGNKPVPPWSKQPES
jgi:glycosyltransferase involved in cell wall biosynthesis